MSKASITAAVEDQHGRHWISYGTSERSHTFLKSDLVADGTKVFSALAAINVPCLQRAGQDKIKRIVEEHSEFTSSFVADQPGWLGSNYVCGDGTIVGRQADDVIVAFTPNMKFRPVGALKSWQLALAPLVTDQRLPLFGLMLSLAGPLRRFAPPHYLNPLVEVVGVKQTGKSSIGALAASVWAGNPESDCGGGESWYLTGNAIDDVRESHRDSFLFLDETNLTGGGNRSEFFSNAIGALAGTSVKRRHGDVSATSHHRLAALSATNSPLGQIINQSLDDDKEAVLSRMITVRVDGDDSLGVLSFVPPGYRSARDAIEEIKTASFENYGAAGRMFVRKLCRNLAHDEAMLKRVVSSCLQRYISKSRSFGGDARVQKSLALVFAAGHLAARWNIIPASWGSAEDVVLAVHAMAVAQSRSSTPLQRVLTFVESNTSTMVASEQIATTSRAKFDASAGHIIEQNGRRALLISPKRFQRDFPDYRSIIKDLRNKGLVKTEGGVQPKLVIWPPASCRHLGRVYWIWLSE